MHFRAIRPYNCGLHLRTLEKTEVAIFHRVVRDMSKMFTDDAMTWFAHAFQSGLVPSENVWIIISWISFFFVSFPPLRLSHDFL